MKDKVAEVTLEAGGREEAELMSTTFRDSPNLGASQVEETCGNLGWVHSQTK